MQLSFAATTYFPEFREFFANKPRKKLYLVNMADFLFFVLAPFIYKTYKLTLGDLRVEFFCSETSE